MTSMTPTGHKDYGPSEHERIPLAHGLTAVIIRYRDDEPRPERPRVPSPAQAAEAHRQAALDAWNAEQAAAGHRPPGGGAA